jgi:hypothetical protein
MKTQPEVNQIIVTSTGDASRDVLDLVDAIQAETVTAEDIVAKLLHIYALIIKQEKMEWSWKKEAGTFLEAYEGTGEKDDGSLSPLAYLLGPLGEHSKVENNDEVEK